jgi:UDP-N-acetylmuramoyl-L-alanyl-D-glutamate--2,6-diaminopimelate ligase
VRTRTVEFLSRLGITEFSKFLPESLDTITDDTRKLKSNSVFVIRAGVNGQVDLLLEKALKSNAAIILSPVFHSDGRVFEIPDLSKKMDLILRLFYGNLTEKYMFFGITGTNGKTTMATLAHSILSHEKGPGILIGTIETKIDTMVRPSQLTTPGLFELWEILDEGLRYNCSHVVMEVSSHSLDQNRLQGIQFDVAVFSNLSQDHLDYHKDMESYFSAKKKLFTENAKKDAKLWVCVDNPYGLRLKSEVANIKAYSGVDENSEANCIKKEMIPTGMNLRIKIYGQEIDIVTPLVGSFNIENITGVCAACHSIGISVSSIVNAFKSTKVRGRLESLALKKGTAIIDYAHTPDALQRVLEVLKEFALARILVVFGCGGDRDRGKRPLMGSIAERFGDRVFVTSDNPRSEDPEQIIDDIMSGMQNPQRAVLIPDRAQAIQIAHSELEEGDLLLVAGKGHENYQILANETIHFDDIEVIKKCEAELWR